MSFSRVYDLYVDVAKPGGPACLLNGTSGAQRTAAPEWMEGDSFVLRVHFREVGGLAVTTSAVELATGDELILAAKTSISATELLFSATSWTKVSASGDIYYQTTLNLNTTEMGTALTGASLSAVIDLEVQNSDNTSRITFRFNATVNKAVYDGESDPVPGTPDYPSPSAVMVKNPDGGNYRVKDGNLQLWNATQSKFQTVWLVGVDAETQLTFGAGET